jgi:hypothetical protein
MIIGIPTIDIKKKGKYGMFLYITSDYGIAFD